ncbi:unnamed protein product [Vicia faba]|uniref:PB1-like domain-containing protein n=1 Tax=Vicia faba TaxID=3906 RepID=A0AAV1AM35_VICFA|nr:unnamed protein product [Vicia faba]
MKLYVGEVVTEMDWDCDVDFLSYMQIEDLIKAEGYCNIKCLWYWNLNFSFSRGLRPLNSDKDVLRLVKDEGSNGEENVEETREVNGEGETVEENVEVNGEGATIEVNGEGAIIEETVEVNGEGEIVEETVDVTEEVREEENVEVTEEVSEDENVEVNNEKVSDEENVVVTDVENSGEDSETDPDYNLSSEDDEDDDEEVDLDELDLGQDVVVDWQTILPTVTTEKPSRMNDISDNESCDSDVLHTPPDSDVEVDI